MSVMYTSLHRLIYSMAERILAQSELLSRRAEKTMYLSSKICPTCGNEKDIELLKSLKQGQCDYCGDEVATKHDEIDRCDLCWEHHYNLLNPDYAAKNPVPPHKEGE